MTEGSPKIKVGFLGGGKIAKAMAEALVRGGVCSPDDICMSARTEESRQAIRAQGYSVGTNDEASLRSTCYCEDGLSDELRELLLRLLRAFGIVHSVPEMYFDAYCAVSGSSPAFVCTFIEALIDGAVRCGLPRKLATEAALQSVRGTATLLQSKGIHPALIRDDITTPGGISIAGLMAMEARAFRAAVADAMEAAYERSVKMTTEF
ncbi:pyrroline-5-carboxylate reductase, putative [Eimeria maxima]|uniref:Pyrroline-5-carboxylate reductase, putative n=1 Tax=Eimeria maxima TaxID=5804 RepID=U6M6K7_EIMMA|nr:pyrroline-5-carboxylate reductase, putative [Eimeria maxima]CDJ57310.1 pyrroline-5-carboxylate reductase, putative [Eimeria maxima]